MAPFEGMVNRGTQHALRKTSLREVTSSFLGWSSSTQPSSQKRERLSASPSLSISPTVPLCCHRFLDGFIYGQIHYLSPSFYCCFNCLGVSWASDRGYLAGQSTASYHCQTCWRSRQSEVKVLGCFFAFVSKKKLLFIDHFIDKGIVYRQRQADNL